MTLRQEELIDLPVVQLNPTSCFSITTYDISDADGITPTFAKIVDRKLSVHIDDVRFFGTHVLTLTAIVNDSVATRLPFGG